MASSGWPAFAILSATPKTSIAERSRARTGVAAATSAAGAPDREGAAASAAARTTSTSDVRDHLRVAAKAPWTFVPAMGLPSGALKTKVPATSPPSGP